MAGALSLLGGLGALGNLNATNSRSQGESNSNSQSGGSSGSNGYSYGGTYGTGASASAFSHQMMMEANEFNAEQARLNREWQERMSNTAYQRAMKDLRKAGLNPILAYTSGASTPTGSYASSAMGNAYTDNYSESRNTSHSSEYSFSESHSRERSELTSNIANQLASITGATADLLSSIFGSMSDEEYNRLNKVTGGAKPKNSGEAVHQFVTQPFAKRIYN